MSFGATINTTIHQRQKKTKERNENEEKNR